MAAPSGNTLDLAALLDRSQRETVFGLWSFDSQVGEKQSKGGGSFPVSLAPVPQGAPAFGAGGSDSDIAAEGCGEDFERGSLYLADVDAFRVGWLSRVSRDTHPVSAALDANRPVGIKDTGEIGERDFIHTTHSTLRWGGDF